MEAQGYDINIIWIPAHKVIAGNELADGKAKEAIRSGRDSQIGIPPEDFKLKWKNLLYEEFLEWCETSGADKGNFYMIITYLNLVVHGSIILNLVEGRWYRFPEYEAVTPP